MNKVSVRDKFQMTFVYLKKVVFGKLIWNSNKDTNEQ